MLIKWLGGKPPKCGGSASSCPIFRATAFLVIMLALVSLSSGVPSSMSTPVLAPSIGIPITATADSSSVTGRIRVPKQVGLPVGAVGSGGDHESSSTHHHGHGHGFMGDHDHHHQHHQHGHGDGKYFMYAHVPAYDEYEYGYRRGNDYHFQERYEKYGPAWNFKTKVKWGDKYGGHGEHYWDYNHAGSHHDGGGGGGGGGGSGEYGHGHGHYSEPVPSYERQPQASNGHKKVAMIHKRHSERDMDKWKSPGSKRISVRKEMSILPYPTGGGDKMKAETGMPAYILDRTSGQVIDTVAGNAYWLRPNSHF